MSRRLLETSTKALHPPPPPPLSSAVARFRINRGRLCERTKQKFSESHVPEVQTLQTSPCNLGPLRPPHQLYASSITNQLNCFRLIRSYSGHVAAEKRRRRCWATLNHWKREREGNVEQCFSSHDKWSSGPSVDYTGNRNGFSVRDKGERRGSLGFAMMRFSNVMSTRVWRLLCRRRPRRLMNSRIISDLLLIFYENKYTWAAIVSARGMKKKRRRRNLNAKMFRSAGLYIEELSLLADSVRGRPTFSSARRLSKGQAPSLTNCFTSLHHLSSSSSSFSLFANCIIVCSGTRGRVFVSQLCAELSDEWQQIKSVFRCRQGLLNSSFFFL